MCDFESLLQAHEHVDEILAVYEQALLAPGTPADAPREHVQPDPYTLAGQNLAHYQVLEWLGGGGMGVVYKAHDTKLDRFVALKFLPPELARDAEARERFILEANAASALDHPNIAVVHDFDERHEGRLFIAMAYYPGETLKKKIVRGPLPVEKTLDYAMQTAEGLMRAHEAGIVHRDVKPANIIVTERGLVKIVDFGLVKVGDVDLTKTGATRGTISYMSPEQTRGEAVDYRTDLWSLGVVLYEMLTFGAFLPKSPFRNNILKTIKAKGPSNIPMLESMPTVKTRTLFLVVITTDLLLISRHLFHPRFVLRNGPMHS